jgi:hypothetical protein
VGFRGSDPVRTSDATRGVIEFVRLVRSDIPYSSISGLNIHKMGLWLLEVGSGAGDYQFSAGSREGASQLANLIRQCIDQYNRPEPAQVIAAIDPMDQLRKLVELHAAGVVTDDEFAAKKAQLLDQV